MSQIVLINPRYPFGKDQIFLNGSWCIIAAVLSTMGHVVKMVDLNLDRLADRAVQEALKGADLVGITLTGSAHIPEMFKLIPEIRCSTHAPILLGGQVVERLLPQQFEQIFSEHAGVVQIRNFDDLAYALGCNVADIPSPYAVALEPVWRQMGEKRMVEYLRHEMTLVVSQGCHFRCAFCAASKGMPEQFRQRTLFESDLLYLATLARTHGIQTINFYASSLDFFQNSETVVRYLEALVRVREETGVNIRLRCLSCLTSFVRAYQEIPNLKERLAAAGLWCVGFGSDGTDEKVWKAEKKGHNTVAKMVECLELCQEMGLRAELLMVLGFPEENPYTLAKTVVTSLWTITMWDDIIIRPYLAKPFVPGNKGWETDQQAVAQVVHDPRLFYHLDFAALGSPLTHPRFLHRWASNLAYLVLCSLIFVGKGSTSPLLPQGGKSVLSAIAKRVNQLMPFDR